MQIKKIITVVQKAMKLLCLHYKDESALKLKHNQ